MASSLDGTVRVYTTNSYAVMTETLANPTVLDADVYTYVNPGGVLYQWNGAAWVNYTPGFILYRYDGANWVLF